MSLGPEIRLQEPLDQVLDRYAQIHTLIDRALASITAGDRDQALIVSAAVVAKCIALDGRLGLVNLRDGGGDARPPSSPSSPSRRRPRRAA